MEEPNASIRHLAVDSVGPPDKGTASRILNITEDAPPAPGDYRPFSVGALEEEEEEEEEKGRGTVCVSLLLVSGACP